MDPLETWKPPAGENPSSLQDFLQAFEPPNPGFPRSPPSAHGGSWTPYAFVAGIDKPCSRHRQTVMWADAPSHREYPAHQRCEATSLIVIKSGTLGTAFPAISLGSTLCISERGLDDG